jgi:hypothetical protein
VTIDKDILSKRIDKLLEIAPSQADSVTVNEIFFSTVSLVKMLYSDDSPQLKSLVEGKKGIVSREVAHNSQMRSVYALAMGTLKSLKAELELGLISSIEKQATGELFGDFIYMAKEASENGYKDVAAVLASAAIEDSLKKLGKLNGLDLDDKEMTETINSLKTKGLINGPQVKIVSSYVKLRNKAFHAEWDKIDTPEVKSLIAFTEEFIMKHFS